MFNYTFKAEFVTLVSLKVPSGSHPFPPSPHHLASVAIVSCAAVAHVGLDADAVLLVATLRADRVATVVIGVLYSNGTSFDYYLGVLNKVFIGMVKVMDFLTCKYLFKTARWKNKKVPSIRGGRQSRP